MRSALIFTLLLFNFSALSAAERPDFELARVDSAGFVRLAELPPRLTLINFWRHDCPPCVRELPLLLAAAEEGGFRLITVAVQSRAETRAYWSHTPGRLDAHLALLAPANPVGLLRRFGNRSGALPHSVMLDAGGYFCAQRTGEVNQAWLGQARLQCD
ncbi:MAG: TlpA disulfide reductase family protein [Thiohalomonadaceae bacterium]